MIGEVSALVDAAESAFLCSLEGLDAVAEVAHIDSEALRRSWIDVSRAQQVIWLVDGEEPGVGSLRRGGRSRTCCAPGYEPGPGTVRITAMTPR